MKTLNKDELKLGGFAGLKEHRLVTDSLIFGKYKEQNTWNGIGNFVYLADAQFNPHGETHLHPHKEVDVISVIVEGRIDHEGSLKNGEKLNQYDVQVQRAGGEGFAHNEINPDDKKNRMIQIWILPERSGDPAGYKLYKPKWGKVTRVYGGRNNPEIYESNTIMEVAMLKKDDEVDINKIFIAYLTTGKGILNDREITAGTIVTDEILNYIAIEDSLLIIFYLDK